VPDGYAAWAEQQPASEMAPQLSLTRALYDTVAHPGG
jgi:hypothetical protein